ncbi:MAG TPA: cupredoxin domain-containing protein, partial [Thermomicrobiales bacterium]|nr:cupredoxin domain-containing protein [Thermomicrobiales bacterium]
TCVGGSTATAGGLVFTGESNGNFDAYDAKTGDRLWQFQTGAGVNAPAVTYEVDGVQYVAVAAGGNEQENTPRGDSIWAFSLQGALGPAAAPSLATPVPTAPAAAPATTVEITGYDIGFQPASFTIPANTDVRVIVHNTGQLEHNFSIDKLNISATLEPGETGEVTINAPAGVYTYYCNIDDHATAGMTGTMFVK